jgi:2-polyprenyl-6-hydroxyphenyl methylase / 3-demethylubiquinone-9 3-methyltransferase
MNSKSSFELRQLYGDEYVQKFSEKQSPKRIERLIRHIRLQRSDYVVDFACGNGMLMDYLALKVCSYVGVDFSQEFVNEAIKRKEKQGVANAIFVCSEIVDFCNINEQNFDVAFALDFVEHVYDDELLKILSSIKKVIKKGGRFYIHTPNLDFFVEKLKQKSLILKQFPEHVAVRSPEQLTSLLESAGFRVEKAFLLPHYNILKYIHFLSFVPFLGKYFKARIFVEAINQ